VSPVRRSSFAATALALAVALVPGAGSSTRADCLPGGIALSLEKGPGDGEVTLRWTGGDPSFDVYRAEQPEVVAAPENLLGSTEGREWTDGASPDPVAYYLVESSSDLRQLGFASEGLDGNFDLDLGVPGGTRGGRPGDYGAYSVVNPGAESFVLVHGELGFIDAAAPWCVEHVLRINEVHPGSDPELGELRWVHEVPTVTRSADDGRWHLFFMTYPENADGERLFEYGWLGHKTMASLPGPAVEPDPASLDAREERLFAGLAWNDRLAGSTDGWAEGNPRDPVPGNTRYVAYAEPAAWSEGGRLYLALVAIFCPGDDCRGDVILLRSDDGEDWEFRGTLLVADDAKAWSPLYTHFTAPAFFRAPEDGSLRLLVSPTNVFDTYQGLVEFEVDDLDAARLVRDEAGRPVARFEVPPEGPFVHTGAGCLHGILGRRVLGKHFPGEPRRFRVFVFDPPAR